jgi:hypothetical protein
MSDLRLTGATNRKDRRRLTTDWRYWSRAALELAGVFPFGLNFYGTRRQLPADAPDDSSLADSARFG